MAPPFPIFSRDHHPIRELGDWEAFARPASPEQWRPQHRPYELANVWLADAGVGSLRSVLDLLPATSNFTPEHGVAQAQTVFDQFGDPRRHDVLIVGNAAGGRTVVGIEGKANETFGETLAEYDKAASRKAERGESTNASERLDNLTQVLGGWLLPDADEDEEHFRSLRFDLFAAVAGTVAAAADEGATQAVFGVQELLTQASSAATRGRNAADIRGFLKAIAPAAESRSSGEAWIGGPAKVARRTVQLPSTIAIYVATFATEVL